MPARSPGTFTLAIASGKGDTGKTLLATNLSALAAEGGLIVWCPRTAT
ncbi:MAG: nucleotide-binding protein [Coriobacteriia bacterium]